jgi:5'-phosphate synthase pdxT subunit
MADRKDYLTVGVLALQGAFKEHLQLLREAAQRLSSSFSSASASSDVDAGADKTTTTTRWKKRAAGVEWRFIEVRTAAELARCDALIIPGGESTTMSLVAARSGLLEPLREFVKHVNFRSPPPPPSLLSLPTFPLFFFYSFTYLGRFQKFRFVPRK